MLFRGTVKVRGPHRCRDKGSLSQRGPWQCTELTTVSYLVCHLQSGDGGSSADTQGAVTENSALKGFVSKKEVQLLFSVGIILSNTRQCLLCLKLILDFLRKVSDCLKGVPDQALESTKYKGEAEHWS